MRTKTGNGPIKAKVKGNGERHEKRLTRLQAKSCGAAWPRQALPWRMMSRDHATSGSLRTTRASRIPRRRYRAGRRIRTRNTAQSTMKIRWTATAGVTAIAPWPIIIVRRTTATDSTCTARLPAKAASRP